jgi:hypothetical protein
VQTQKQTGNEAFYFIAGESFHYTAGELWFEKPRVAPLPGREAGPKHKIK